MKARIIKTGEIVTISEYSTITLDYCDSYGDPIEVSPDEIELIKDSPDNEENIDWEHRRYEIAKEVLAASFSTPMEGTSILSYVKSCVQVADILIEELKKKDKQ